MYNSNLLNSIADKLAKAVISASYFIFDYITFSKLQLLFNYDHLHIESSSRKAIKQIQNNHFIYQFLQLIQNSFTLILFEQHHMNQSTTLFMLNLNTSDQNCISTFFGQHHQRYFKFKLFINELLTMIQLHLY